MRRHTLEGTVAGIWVNILQIIFPAREGYTTFPEFIVDEGSCDLLTQHSTLPGPPAQAFRVKFLITQCKRVNLEGHNWQGQINQAERYWRGMPIAYLNTRKFAIIAVGRYVRFYEWRHNLDQLTPIEDIGDLLFHIRRECLSVQNVLDYIKNA